MKPYTRFDINSGTTACGLTCVEIYNSLSKEKISNISVEDIKNSINKHIVSNNIKSATIDPNCRYILTDFGRFSAEEYSKSIAI